MESLALVHLFLATSALSLLLFQIRAIRLLPRSMETRDSVRRLGSCTGRMAAPGAFLLISDLLSHSLLQSCTFLQLIRPPAPAYKSCQTCRELQCSVCYRTCRRSAGARTDAFRRCLCAGGLSEICLMDDLQEPKMQFFLSSVNIYWFCGYPLQKAQSCKLYQTHH
jgi:hypothetical protein